MLALRWRDIDLALGCLRVRQTVYEGKFDDPKTRRSKRTVPLGAKGIEVLSAFKPQGIDPEALVLATRRGTPFSRRNLRNRRLAPTCEKLGIEGDSAGDPVAPALGAFQWLARFIRSDLSPMILH